MRGEQQLIIKKLGFSVISLTFAITTLLGAWILISAVSDSPEISQTAMERLERVPASVSGNSARLDNAKTMATAKVKTIDVGCLDQSSRDIDTSKLESQSRQVRLKARVCKDQSVDWALSSLVNRTNGFEATLFFLEGGQLTTDYIPLTDGENQLMLEMNGPSGRRLIADFTVSYQN